MYNRHGRILPGCNFSEAVVNIPARDVKFKQLIDAPTTPEFFFKIDGENSRMNNVTLSKHDITMSENTRSTVCKEESCASN